jgi:hypothetical protein
LRALERIPVNRIRSARSEPEGRSERSLDERTIIIPEKFNPAPIDKYAVDPKQALRSDIKSDGKLGKGLQDTFPASGPRAAPSRVR